MDRTPAVKLGTLPLAQPLREHAASSIVIDADALPSPDAVRCLLPNITAGPFRSLGASHGVPSAPCALRRSIMPGDVVPWLPGQFRRHLHAVPDTDDDLNFRGVIALRTACSATALPWKGATLPFPLCPACERIVGAAPTTGGA